MSRLIKAGYVHTLSCVRIREHVSEWFEITQGVRQGDVLSPILFGCVMDWILRGVCHRDAGFRLSPRLTLSDLDFADDVAVCEDDAAALELRMAHIRTRSRYACLQVSKAKTKVMGIAKYPAHNLSGRTSQDISWGFDVEVAVQWKKKYYNGWLCSVVPPDSACSHFQVFVIKHNKAPLLKILYDDGDISFVITCDKSGWLTDQDGDKHHFHRTGRLRSNGSVQLRTVHNGSSEHKCRHCEGHFSTARGLHAHEHQCKGKIEDLSLEQIHSLDHSRYTAMQQKNLLRSWNTTFDIGDGEGGYYETVQGFSYLGAWISVDGRIACELSKRLQKANVRFNALRHIWKDLSLNIKHKIRLYQAIVLSTLLYGAETWPIRNAEAARLNTFHLRCLRYICRISYLSHVPSSAVLHRCHLDDMPTILRIRRLLWMGHVWRMDPLRLPQIILNWDPVHERPDANTPC